ncbi:MAG: hypothetical protein AAGG68_28615 [Bacteroidota bacterium]
MTCTVSLKEVNSYLAKKNFEDHISTFTGLTNGIGFKGMLVLYNKTNDISVVLYLGKVSNLAYKAGVWIGKGNVAKDKDFAINHHKLGDDASKWSDYLEGIHSKGLSYAKFSKGGTQDAYNIISNAAINVEFASGSQVEFLIKDVDSL